MKVSLYAPPGYNKLTAEQKANIVNGCGSQAMWFKVNHMWGLNVSEACNIHDYMYRIGETLEDKKVADRVFLNNMNRIIEAKGGFFKSLRYIRAKEYYLAVKYFGGPAFWAGKNDHENQYEIEV